jgi:hypothetical protein
MSHPLDGCWRKVERANIHLEFFRERVEALIKQHDLYGIDTKDDPQTGQVIIYGEAFVEPLSEEWGTIIGDVVHNLRSTLDHLVWQLTLANGHMPPAVIPRKRSDLDYRWRQIGFPIYSFDPRKRYPSGRRISWRWQPPDGLWGVRPALRTEFQRLQPFYRRKKPDRHPLAVLDELWNIDKHRHLHLPPFLVWLYGVRSVKPLSFAPEITLRLVKAYGPRPFKGRAEIGRVEQVGPHRSPILKMYVETDIAYSVAFEKGPPAHGAGVIQTLEGLRDTVVKILGKFDSEFT